jgi:hypothetical protein
VGLVLFQENAVDGVHKLCIVPLGLQLVVHARDDAGEFVTAPEADYF